MKKRSIGLSITVAALLVGCGGGSSSDISSAKISGTVPGTLIEAFCDNNYYAQVSSTQNGTNEHPFEIEVPTNTNCRLVMTTNENDPANRIITLIGFTNGSTIVLEQDINLGYIPLEIEYENVDDIDGDHVVDSELIIDPNGASINDDYVHDDDHNGLIDSYDDEDGDNIVNAYEDDDNDGIENIHDDEDEYEEDESDNDDEHEEDESDNDDEHEEDEPNNDTDIVLPAGYTVNAGRLLGSQCAQCHGTNGISTNSWDSIAGESNLEDEIYEDDEPIMMAQAHGYTSEEIILIGDWLKTLTNND